MRASGVVNFLLDCVRDSCRYPFYFVPACPAEGGVAVLEGAIGEVIINWLC